MYASLWLCITKNNETIPVTRLILEVLRTFFVEKWEIWNKRLQTKKHDLFTSMQSSNSCTQYLTCSKCPPPIVDTVVLTHQNLSIERSVIKFLNAPINPVFRCHVQYWHKISQASPVPLCPWLLKTSAFQHPAKIYTDQHGGCSSSETRQPFVLFQSSYSPWQLKVDRTKSIRQFFSFTFFLIWWQCKTIKDTGSMAVVSCALSLCGFWWYAEAQCLDQWLHWELTGYVHVPYNSTSRWFHLAGCHVPVPFKDTGINETWLARTGACELYRNQPLANTMYSTPCTPRIKAPLLKRPQSAFHGCGVLCIFLGNGTSVSSTDFFCLCGSYPNLSSVSSLGFLPWTWLSFCV
jgi:hypothetical protein